MPPTLYRTAQCATVILIFALVTILCSCFQDHSEAIAVIEQLHQQNNIPTLDSTYQFRYCKGDKYFFESSISHKPRKTVTFSTQKTSIVDTYESDKTFEYCEGETEEHTLWETISIHYEFSDQQKLCWILIDYRSDDKPLKSIDNVEAKLKEWGYDFPPQLKTSLTIFDGVYMNETIYEEPKNNTMQDFSIFRTVISKSEIMPPLFQFDQ